MKRIVSILVAVLALGSATAALAFPHLYFWTSPANGISTMSSAPGAAYTYAAGSPAPYPAGNVPIYGTGGARDYGVTCASCHTKAPGLIDASVVPTPAWQLINGNMAYKPGQQYSITVNLINEQKAVGQAANNLNGMALTIENQNGQGVGIFANDAATPVTTNNCPAPTFASLSGAAESNITTAATTYLVSPASGGATAANGACYTVIFTARLNTTSWTFKWTAPAAGAGPATVFYGVVDGDSSGKNSTGDDVKQGKTLLVEGM